MADRREHYIERLQERAGLLAKQLKDAETARGDEKRVRELLAAQTACEAAEWLLGNRQFRSDLESVPEETERSRRALAELSDSAGEFAEFLNAEAEFLLRRKVPKGLVNALKDSCEDLRSRLLDGVRPDELLSHLGTLRDLACQEHRRAMEGVKAQPGRLLALAKRVFLCLGGGLVIAFNKLGGLAVVVQTMGLAAPVVAVADAVSVALGGAMVAKAVRD